MKLSIITVVYNNEATIAEAIESVFAQDYPDVEYIIIDGASSDGTLRCLQSYANRLSTWVSEPDKGIYDAMNKGIGLCTGEIVGLLNSDDLYAYAGVLSRVALAFKTHPDLDAVYGNLVYVKADEVGRVVRKWKSQPYTSRYFRQGGVPPHPTIFVRRSVYERFGRFNTDFKLAADYELMLRLMERYQIKTGFVDEVWVRMRLGGVTNKSWINILRGNLEIRRAWRVNGLRFPGSLFFIRPWLKLKQYF